jgi:inhibitor of cysteine peptidase
MKKLLVLVMTSMLALCLIAGCSSSEVKANIDPEKMISTSVDQEFVIAVDSNPTTGYDWEVSYDDNMLSLAEEEYSPDKEPGLLGAGGTQYFTFKALKKGDTEITLTYKRSWETDYAEQKVFNVNIK